MSKNYANVVGATKKSQASKVPQTQPLVGTNQQLNNAGGYSFVVDEWTQLERFLILGSEGGTYYVAEKALTLANAKNLEKCIKLDGKKVVDTIVAISDAGRAPKNASAIFALAVTAATGDAETKKYAFMNMPKVARTATDLFSFVEQYKQFHGGFGTVPKKGIQAWYQSKTVDQTGYQLVKYRQRNGWTHHDVLSLAHVKATDTVENNLYAYAKALAGDEAKFDTELLPRIVQGYELIKVEKDAKKAAQLIADYKLPRETVPTELLNSTEVWAALLPHMQATALVRNLGKMTSIGLIKPLSEVEKFVRSKLQDEKFLKAGRVHPVNLLVASKVYGHGRGIKGDLTWTPSRVVMDALDSAFYASFPNVEPTNKNFLLALDVSGSMGWSYVDSIPGLNAREVAAAMTLVTMATEPNTHVMAFQDKLVPIDISPKMRLDQVVRKVSNLPFGGTDCSQPMLYAIKNKLDVDAFMVYTDNETYAGQMHPSEALKLYRQQSGRAAKSIVLGVTATEFSIADPKDVGSLDVVGFDTNVPTIVRDFVK